METNESILTRSIVGLDERKVLGKMSSLRVDYDTQAVNDDVANADDTFALPKGTEITREIALDAKKHDALLLLTMSVD